MAILVVEDAPEFQTLISMALSNAGFGVQVAGDGERGVEMARAMNPELIVLDLGLPGIDGLEACRQMRSFTNAPVIMLTAKDEETDLLVGLAAGADDYMTKPFSPKELVARVQVIMRRPRDHDDSVDEHLRLYGPIEIDTRNRRCRISGVETELSGPEFDLIALFIEHPNMVFGPTMLARTMWGLNGESRIDEVDDMVRAVASRLRSSGRHTLASVDQAGWRLAAA